MFKSEEELADMEKTVETNTKKNLVIIPDGRYGLFRVVWEDGRGVLPESLKGQYTSQSQGEKAIKSYISNHRETKRLEKMERDQAKKEAIDVEPSSTEKEEEEESKEEGNEEGISLVMDTGKTFLD